MQLEDRLYPVEEIKKIFAIKPRTWRTWRYGVGGKHGRKNQVPKDELGLVKVPNSNYFVVNPKIFLEFWNDKR